VLVGSVYTIETVAVEVKKSCGPVQIIQIGLSGGTKLIIKSVGLWKTVQPKKQFRGTFSQVSEGLNEFFIVIAQNCAFWEQPKKEAGRARKWFDVRAKRGYAFCENRD
jgi:hypothetical protein